MHNKTGLVYHPDFLKHITGKEHPENPQRLKAIVSSLEKSGLWSKLQKIEARHSTLEWIEKVHSKNYVQQLQAAGKKGAVLLDSDTMVGPESFAVAVLAVSGVLAACDAVVAGKVRNAFCAVRPPGHHAEKERAMGFCLFNNVAIGAFHARAVHGFERVAVLDFDVHHGNGTQDSFAADAGLFYASTHQWPAYPGTGAADERGGGDIVNR